jgi:uncharacterized protein
MTQVPQDGWRAALHDYIAEQAKPQEKFGHQPRLYALTQLIGAGEAYDDDIVYAAVYLHDLGVFAGHRPKEPELLARWDNTAYAVERAPAILESLGFPAEKTVAVQACIATHQPGHAPETIEATILRDADILEQLGAVGVLRTACKVGRDTRFETFTPAVASLRRAMETLPAMIRLPQTRVLAEPRVAALRHFLRAVEAEAGELLL